MVYIQKIKLFVRKFGQLMPLNAIMRPRKVASSNPRSGRVPMSFSKNLCTINTDCSYGEGQHREETHT